MKPYQLYISLGDSMSIDYYAGPGLGAASLLYKNRDDLYPEFEGQDLITLNPDCEFLPRAKNGARIENVLQAIEQLDPDPRKTLVTLTVGGNDMIAAVGSKKPWLPRFFEQLDQALSQLKQLFPDLTLLYGNIYDPGDGTGRVQSGHDLWAEGFALLPELNRRILEKAKEHGGIGVDIYSHTLGHTLRHDDPDYEHYRPDDPSPWIFYNIEPTKRGSSEIRRLFLKAARQALEWPTGSQLR